MSPSQNLSTTRPPRIAVFPQTYTHLYQTCAITPSQPQRVPTAPPILRTHPLTCPPSAPSSLRLYKLARPLEQNLILTFLQSLSSSFQLIIRDLLHCTARTGPGLNLLRGLQRGNFCWTATCCGSFSLMLFARADGLRKKGWRRDYGYISNVMVDSRCEV
jgi:hypothetical protein